MTRGTLVLFVGLFSLIFLKRKLSATRWFALVVVVLGVAIVGLSGIIEQKAPPPTLPGNTEPKLVNTILQRTVADVNSSAGLRTVFGMLLIFLAQTFTASQFVLEESIMHKNSISPLQMVAFEGTFGLLLTLLFQILLHFTYGRTTSGQGGYFDMKAGWEDITQHRSIWASSLLIMVCIGSFNFFGLSVTRNVSATSRSTIDTCRVLFVWLCSLGLGWEKFRYLQVVGFALLVYGEFGCPPCW
jgi:drug/metabolite transporter (DMT)-like permease